MLTLDIGVAVNKNQDREWWPSIIMEMLAAERAGYCKVNKLITVGSAQPDFNKCAIVDMAWKPPPDDTGVNRSGVVEEHLAGESDGIMWVDDDTAIPVGTIKTLVAHWDQADVIGGLYRKRSAPYDVIGYKRLPSGAYVPLSEFQPGEIIECDAIGMGCTLVKRAVYESIHKEYEVVRRKLSGSLLAVHHDDIVSGELPAEYGNRLVIRPNGLMAFVQEMEPVENFDIKRWPYYAMEYQRTEDFYFCEMAQRVGARIIVDTSVVCKHWGSEAISEVDYRRELARKLGASNESA